MRKTFAEFVDRQHHLADASWNNLLHEVSELFNKMAINDLFDDEVRELMQTASKDDQEQLRQLLGFDWTGYIDRSLRNAGIKEYDLDHSVHDIVVRLLVSPGNLFRGWKGQPLDRRFKASVKNAISNLIEKRQTRRRNLPTVSINQQEPANAPVVDDETIERFRRTVLDRLGELALAVLDARLEGQETKSLVGDPDLGEPTSYRIKRIVQQIKDLAMQTFDDPSTRWQLRRLLQAEEETLKKRFSRIKEQEVVSPFEKVLIALGAVPDGLTTDRLRKSTGLSDAEFIAAMKWLHRTGKLNSTWIKGERGFCLAV